MAILSLASALGAGIAKESSLRSAAVKRCGLALCFVAIVSQPLAPASPFAADGEKPNIVLILADDLGYGDVRCYNDQSKVATPHIDRLSHEGMRFTDAHSPCTVCTPTRYSLMTGQMAFRVPNGGTVFTGVGGPSLIASGRLTLPGMLRENGYATACVGKWHVGMTFLDKDGQPVRGDGIDAVRRVDFSRRIAGGPVDHGFESFFGTACCPTTDWLYAFIENDRVPVPPTGLVDTSRLPKHPYANDCRPGLIAPNFPMEKVDLIFLEKSREFLEQHVRQSPNKRFFLFHSTQAVHLPSFAAPQFQKKTQAGPHGDFIHQLDGIVGELLATLEKLGVAQNTIVIFTSDNGPEVTSVIHMRADHGHDGSRPWRGMKRDNWEGGHRVPFLVRWPGYVKAGTTSAQLTSLTDVMATVAAIIGATLPDDAAEDSFNMLPAWLEEQPNPIRPYLLLQAFAGQRTLSIRRGEWKYLDHTGSGGNRYDTNPGLKPFHLPDATPDAPGQLYNLSNDPGETTNLYDARPEVVVELKALLEQSKASGRSRPLPP
ncbi:MAG: arylsulfatase [Planctomycetaceae bacterium]|nr:arylsulfatase [Planctomycetaceae bacterium]